MRGSSSCAVVHDYGRWVVSIALPGYFLEPGGVEVLLFVFLFARRCATEFTRPLPGLVRARSRQGTVRKPEEIRHGLDQISTTRRLADCRLQLEASRPITVRSCHLTTWSNLLRVKLLYQALACSSSEIIIH
jgi:hypothetical protein